ncbi:SusC/RagA family TonB-linked outer membrane protein [Chitinophaga caeni]|uniref:SusC/RagA family TonB-linked outer membrane protein n=1 Tax=Chitinophaga caeni TaxID=2029983 RepID=A0A291QZB6_9BACT|nr:TonB-dependent receptor [Chitinophaga caeni]ATL49275.1 SusC/RagA family TonB-linked outer membrane protein [Chitinophaga caeni]
MKFRAYFSPIYHWARGIFRLLTAKTKVIMPAFRPRFFIKFATAILLIFSVSAHAALLGQKITITKRNAPLKEILKEIEKQSGYSFFFSDKDIRMGHNVSLAVKNGDLRDVLNQCFEGQTLTYEIVNNTVVVKQRANASPEMMPSSAAARIKVSGKVVDETGQALPGATVVVKGSNVATVTDENGNYSIDCKPTDILVVSFIGYKTAEAAVEGKNTLNVILKLNVNQLQEQVITAYGSVKKDLYTGAAAQVNRDFFDKRPLNSIANALVGAAPGIQTTLSGGAPNSGAAIRLRGFGSISASSSPLYVVDGVPYDGSISSLDPADIENISVLKDATSAALYGSRGANGVIVITTRKGNKYKPTLSFTANYGVVRRGLPEYDRVNAFQYVPLMWESYRNSMVYGDDPIPLEDASKIASGLYPRFTSGANAGKQNYNGTAYSDISQLLGMNPFNVPGDQLVDENGMMNPNARLLYPEDLNWSDAAENGGRSRQNYQLAYSGGSDKSTYYGSFGYTDMKGYLISSNMKRFNGRVNLDVTPTTWFKTGLNVAGTYVKENEDNSSSNTGYVNPFYFSRYIAPIYPVHAHNDDGTYVLDVNGKPAYDLGEDRPFATGRNAVYENLLNARIQNRTFLSGRTFGEVTFAPFLKLRTNFSADIQSNFQQNYDNKIIGDGSPAGRSTRYSDRTLSYTFNQLLYFDKKWNKHGVSAMAGHENYSLTYNYLSGNKQGQIVDGISELPNFSTINSTTSYQDSKAIESYLGKVSYDYDGKYIVTGSIRRDGNSKFSPDVRWATFWSLGGAWNIHREEFFNANFVDYLRLRASYGKIGNDGGISYYAYQSFYNLGRNNATEPGFVQGTLGNNQLTWESNNSFDLGVEFSFFKGRLSGLVDYFDRKTSGLIFDVPQPLSNGGTTSGEFSISQNVGNMYNRGVELQLTGEVVKTNDINYSITLNATTFKNEITKMPVGQEKIINGTKQLSAGHSIYDYYLRHYYGVDPDNGDALYIAETYDPDDPGTTKIITNKNGGQDTVTSSVSNAKLMYVGESSIPKVYGSMQHQVSYKGLTLSVLLTYQLGGKVYDGSYASLMHAGTYGTIFSTDILKRWQKPGDITDVPRLDNKRISDFSAASDRWLTKASFMNINNITLSYDLPARWLSRINATRASIYVSGENLHMFSARKGMNVNGEFSGTTSNSYTYNRIMTMGVNLNF